MIILGGESQGKEIGRASMRQLDLHEDQEEVRERFILVIWPPRRNSECRGAEAGVGVQVQRRTARTGDSESKLHLRSGAERITIIATISRAPTGSQGHTVLNHHDTFSVPITTLSQRFKYANHAL